MDTLKEAQAHREPVRSRSTPRTGTKRYLRMYNTEPEECRKSDVGKNLDKTLKARISQEAGMTKRHCR